MKILKKYILLTGMLLFVAAANLCGQGKVFYGDADVECHGLSIKLEQCYLAGDVIKMKLIVNNLTDNYVVINPEDIIANTSMTSEIRASLRRPIMVPPKDVKRTSLVFARIPGTAGSQISFSLKKIGFSGAILHSFDTVNIIPQLGYKLEYKQLTLKVIEANPKDQDYALKLLVSYSRENFLAINYHKAFISMPDGKIFNNRKSAFCFDNKGQSQRMLMIFPNSGFTGKNQGTLNLNDVFKEYEFVIKTGCEAKLNRINGEYVPDQKTEKEEAIEEIE